ncbi:uncharacterized protein BXZ73DRAFT_90826 [Epithele typhae]|uniref:uncharacterized protein n=1 Tax=Epithele typhae TaxID=378194 RepID=UPI002007FA35|nr:uncharacterized protein BXZ73DRAFT_90826 [Epithele typhae]KAH9927144.1 hypothetical protein BXZ73DRAFT_90826 [Epithele typhae]
MSSWGSAYPPPPPPALHRSRSRSPHRASYPPRPSEPNFQEPPRNDWEAYDRERAWANYERDRAAYDHSRRGRSRSPPPGEDVGRKRRRSLSPWERDRYEPRPRYNDDYDTHSRGYGYDRTPYPPPPYASGRRGPPDPHTFDYPGSLRQYAEWFRYYYPQQAMEEDNADKLAEQEAGGGVKPRNGIKTRWEKYKKEFAAQQLQRMFDHHRKSPWFAEKYDPAPEFQAMRMRVKKQGWKGRMDTFLLDLESGRFDPDFSEPVADTSRENGNGDVSAANGAADGATADEKPAAQAAGNDDDMQFNVDVEEDAPGEDSSRNTSKNKSNNTRGEELAVPPEGNQVMIRTIPPDIGRAKLEDTISKIPGFIHLALGDPMQKRSYYRAGWLKFNDDADMTIVLSQLSEKKIEGFKLHVSHITKPFVTRIRAAPEAASFPERLSKDLENAKRLAVLQEEEYKMLLKFKPEPASVNGDHDTAMGELNTTDGEAEPAEMGSEAVERRIEKVMADLQEQGAVDTSDERALEAKRTVIALDLYLAYLRAAFNTCYYCAVVTDHVEELQRKCIKHVRKPLSKSMLQELQAAEVQKADQDQPSAEDGDVPKDKDTSVKDKGSENRDWKRADERWIEWLDSKIALLIDPAGVDPRDYGGKSPEEELARACEQFIKQEDEGKFRCKTCQKLFKATSFVEKHILNKHSELVKGLEDIPYFNNFALDPHRIQPFSHPPQVVGSSQPPPPQAYGLAASAYPVEHQRPPPYNPYGGGYPPYPPPPGPAYFDPYAYPYAGAGGPMPLPPRRDESVVGRRLSDRISGVAPGFDQSTDLLPVPAASAGLPAKPAVSEPGQGAQRGRGRGGAGGPPPPPPLNAKEDPRAQAGRKVSYVDVDQVAEGDVELTY